MTLGSLDSQVPINVFSQVSIIVNISWTLRVIFLLKPPVCLSVQFSHSVMSDSLQPHESQHARPPVPSPSPGVHAKSRPSSHWCHLAISSSVIPFSPAPNPSGIRLFFNESALRMKWPKSWSFSFSISPSEEHPGLISFRMDWLDLLAVQQSRLFCSNYVACEQT